MGRRSSIFQEMKRIDHVNLQREIDRAVLEKFWVIGIGGLKDVWHYASLGNFYWCFEHFWCCCQYEVKSSKKSFLKRVAKQGGYQGKLAEIQSMDPKSFAVKGGTKIAKDPSLVVFEGLNSSFSLSRPVYAMIQGNYPLVIFAHKWLNIPATSLAKGQELWGDFWNNFRYFDGKKIEGDLVKNWDTFGLTNYPLIVTNSISLLMKLSSIGLVCCFIPNLLSLVGATSKTNYGFLKDIYLNLSSCPKPFIIVTEDAVWPYLEEKNSPYSFHPDYFPTIDRFFSEKISVLLKRLNCQFIHFKVPFDRSSEMILSEIKERINFDNLMISLNNLDRLKQFSALVESEDINLLIEYFAIKGIDRSLARLNLDTFIEDELKTLK